tara:strand:+ start:930 stop:1442 length:513 start_codon:yes stop_codon:yes gene_type:complete
MKKFNIHDWQDKQKRLNEQQSIDNIMRREKLQAVVTPTFDETHEEFMARCKELGNSEDDCMTMHGDHVFKEPTNEQSFDDRLAQQMGMSNDEFEDQIASRDIGDESPFLDNDDISPGIELASRTIGKLRQQYRGMSDDIMDDFSVEMIKHFLDNYKAQAAAKAYFTKKGL